MSDKLTNELMAAETKDEITNVINMFNADIKKREVLRATRYNDLLDKLTDQMTIRIEERPDQFTNDDLLRYSKTLQDSVNNAFSSRIDSLPTINLNQTSVNIAVGNDLSIESKHKVRDAIDAILKNAMDNSTQEADYIELKENNDEILQ